MREALRQSGGDSIRVEDDQTQQVYFLVTQERMSILDEQIRAQLQIGFDQADGGQTSPWDPERIKAEGRRLISHEKSS